ncbi:MAG: hypothetical protein A2W90_00515 [Bacteroidetes bacterium GWF2_42_66]|nr:MAG: hypothetical protein A2W92_21650 [Bacteroidetes bacterium GWA2_42_15]OFY02105.1 MAG: hypothetical protein A2W89_11700 [Bacteroidetes bacterium GWE2_42_39]OFY43451.1 MAG: hypothetical protein A2W90_00515 [Bacteroidetes bacterium GWF2_42_66]HBL76537.1 flavodoxin [Prolixibacteraceae bacterium]HCR91626.1 flavodoxin [Prolixibacteraceae bacterium]
MKTLIVYMSTHGCTENVVNELKENLGSNTSIVNLKKNSNPDLKEYGRIIIGGSIHAGQIQRKVRDFCERNLDVLRFKEIGLFICCMYEEQVAKDQLKNAFPEKLHQYSKTEAIFGGEFNFARMNFLEKMIVKNVAHVKESVSNVDHKAIEKFARRMEKTYQPMFVLI